MNNLILTTQYDTNATLISNIFIDKFMPDANGEFVKIYIYLLRSISDASVNVSVSGMADIFNQTEADVVRALKYWSKQNVILLSYDDNKNVTGITLCNLAAKTPAASVYEVHNVTTSKITSDNITDSSVSGIERITPDTAQPSSQAFNNSVVAATQTGSADSFISNTSDRSKAIELKTYTPAQLEALSNEDVEFKMLLHGISNYLGCALSSTEISSIAFFYDTLKFPSELIEYLIEYCAKRGHKKMRYIEKVAIAWADAGIRTVQQAKNETSSHNETTYSVMNAFGISNRDPGQRERDYIAKWTNVYGFGTNIIIEACNRTLKATHQPSFEYADSILTKWKSANIHTQADILKADAQYELSRSKKKQQSVKNTNNRFNNFSQRDTDIDSLESSIISNNN
ncbi:MAG: DnaD domain protein [[Bacteroides] pectinophilus]|nr:DnaD domain protein [[Bacteroides] pectinophilus]